SEYVTAQEHVKGTPEEQAEAAKLAKTGDTTALVALGVGALAIAAGVVLVIARRRMKKNDR
ncbi:MAG: LPXTG cell wall anchor domain-containing protein, partial [Eggerthellaceae bacterium]|nr:LPXTG cell wall anchor domain-containing protein [Eggerthellaceae bacterium]